MKKIKYKFDNLISKNPKGLLVILTLITLFILATIASVITFFDPNQPNFLTNYEELINLTISPSIKFNSNIFLTFLYVIVAMLGLLLISVLIGILTSIIESRLIELRRGRSVVIESNHSVFLGWSNKLFTAIKELSEANRSVEKSSIVVMSVRDKIFMEEYLFREIPADSNSNVICRTGDPSDSKDLQLISPNTARSIVLLATDDEYSDSMVLKRALSLQKNTNVTCPIIAEVNSAENAEALKLLPKLTVIQPRNFIMRLLAQSLKDPGLSKVYSELLTFEESEIYFWPTNENQDKFQKHIVGRTFKEAAFEFEISCLIGVVNNYSNINDKNQNEFVKLLPDNDYIIQSTDRLILISEDDSTIGSSVGKSTFKRFSEKNSQIINLTNNYTKKHITIIGWHSWGEILLNELQTQLPNGSEIDIIYNPELSTELNQNVINSSSNLTINIFKINDFKRDSFKNINWNKTNSILILGNRDKLNIQESDSYTLLTFTHIKNVRDNQTRDINICCEILDPKNAELIEGTRDDEFVASDELVAKYLIQLSENKYLKAVYTDLLDEAGAELFLRNTTEYVNNNQSITFGELVNIGFTKNEIVVGIQLKIHSENHKVNSILSPAKSNRFELNKNDKIIVLANN